MRTKNETLIQKVSDYPRFSRAAIALMFLTFVILFPLFAHAAENYNRVYIRHSRHKNDYENVLKTHELIRAHRAAKVSYRLPSGG